jgi:hypothetical protein
LIKTAVNPPADAWQAVVNIISSIANALIMAFGMVTIIFALNERFNPQAREAAAKMNIPAHLSQPKQRAGSGLQIKRPEPVAAIIHGDCLIVINAGIDRIGFMLSLTGKRQLHHSFQIYLRTFCPGLIWQLS